MSGDLQERGEALEECYEFMLAYGAQGPPSDEGSRAGGQVREFLDRAVKVVDGLAESFAVSIQERGLDPAVNFRAFLAVPDHDARDSLAALEMILAQPVISSQLIDNLNASIHLRALLTDMFLVGEIMGKQHPVVKPQE